MARIDLYRNVHKGQRAQLFALAVELGRADPADGAGRAGLATRLRAAIRELREHALNEETFIHPLLQARAPEVAEALEREHAAADAALAELEDRLFAFARPEADAEAGAELYRAWCRMVSAYLAHLDAEERLAMPALWERCSDAEIAGIIGRFVASRSAAELLHDLTTQTPALAPHERALFVGGVARSGALPAERIWNGLAGVLAPDDLARLRTEAA